MSRKDYISIADVLIEHRPYHLEEDRVYQWECIRDGIAEVLEADNPAFNKILWLAYVNGESTITGKPIKDA